MPYADRNQRLEYLREYRRTHPDKRTRQQHVKRATSIVQRNREHIQAAKAKPCADCGVQYPFYVMQFDHVRGEKAENLSAMAKNRRTLTAIDAEIAKCDVVCANCHFERGHRRGWNYEDRKVM